jgi:hypothetical protein
LKDVAPSTRLRRWYGHRPERFPEFRRRYLLELDEVQPAAVLSELVRTARTARDPAPDETDSGPTPQLVNVRGAWHTDSQEA